MRGNALGSLLGRNILLSGCNTHGNRRNVLARRTRAGSWRASACLFRGDQRLQRGYVDRFRDEGIEPDALRALPIGLAAVSRDGNENGSGAVVARASPYLGRESEAICGSDASDAPAGPKCHARSRSRQLGAGSLRARGERETYAELGALTRMAAHVDASAVGVD